MNHVRRVTERGPGPRPAPRGRVSDDITAVGFEGCFHLIAREQHSCLESDPPCAAKKKILKKYGGKKKRKMWFEAYL